MAKQHLKRIAMPRAWPIPRKNVTFAPRPLPGRHPIARGLPLALVIRDLLKLTETARETRFILNTSPVLVDGVRQKDPRTIVGLMDVIEVGAKHYRMVISTRGKLAIVEEKHPAKKILSIKGKRLYRGKIQITFHDGTTMLTDKEFKVGDSVLVSLPDRKVEERLPFGEKAHIYLIGGKHVGEFGLVENVAGNAIVCKTKEGAFETDKRYAFVVGADKSLFTL